MTIKLFAAIAITTLLATATAASADEGSPISGEKHSTEIEGNVDLTVIQGYQVQTGIGSDITMHQSAGTIFEDTAIKGDVKSTVTQGYQVQTGIGSRIHMTQHAGSIGAPK